ncbi:MAG: hypothetical protein QM820_37820 [Minicystis sp.]
MIPVARVPEPSGFDERARRPGKAWLAEHPGTERPRDFWSPFRELLAEGFAHRCGYTAMLDLAGTIDHFRSCKTHPELTYEWTNLRYASQWINSAKKSVEVLDPYEVGEGWFEILLPSMQLVATERIPPDRRELALATLKRLPIAHDERVLKQRRHWYRLYEAKKLSLEGLRSVAPLIAAAEEKRLAAVRAAEGPASKPAT